MLENVDWIRWMSSWTVLLGALVISFAGIWLLVRLLLEAIERIFVNLRQALANRRSLARLLSFRATLLVWGLFWLAVFSSRTPFGRLEEPFLQSLVRAALVLTAALFVTRAISILTIYLYHRFDISVADNLRQRRLVTQIQFIRKLALLAIWIVAVGLTLMSFESLRNLGGSLLASAGVASVIIGFAAQKSIGNLIAGFQIAFTQPVRIGDSVVIEGEWGTVEEITLTYVVVRIWDLRRLILPITHLVERPFQNWTRNSAQILGEVILFVDYGADFSALREHFEARVTESPLWDGQVQVMQVLDVTEKCVKVRCLVSARDAPTTFKLRCEIREQMLRFMQTTLPASLPRLRLSEPSLWNGSKDMAHQPRLV